MTFPAGRFDILIVAGCDFSMLLSVTEQGSGTPVNVTGWDFRAQCFPKGRTSGEPVFDFDFDNTGLPVHQTRMKAAASDTEKLTAKEYQYDVKAIVAGKTVPVLLLSAIVVEPSATKIIMGEL